ncbi:MAG: hypothetical protein ACJ74O_02905 [Frankiaceae bacterium]
MRRGVLAALLGAPLAALAVPAVVHSTGSSRGLYDAQAVAAARSAFERATAISQQVAVPTRSPGSPQSAAMLEALRRDGERKLATAYDGPALEQERRALETAIGAEHDPSFRVLGGGVRRVTYNQIVVVTHAQVTIAATVWTWWRTAQVRPPGGAAVVSAPESAIDARATVGQGPDGAWKVVSFTWKAHPDERP